jgi:tetratricopeptide (TPR) repeat protein
MKSILLNLFLLCVAESVSASFNIASSEISITHPLSFTNRQLNADLNRTAFYIAIESNDQALVDAQISELKLALSNLKNAFLGAMIMKRAGIGGNPLYKLWLFKKGHELLEDAIKVDPNNPEFRFLRLMIQENAPGFLGYNDSEERDSESIRNAYKSLPENIQKAISDYNKTSKVLKLQRT